MVTTVTSSEELKRVQFSLQCDLSIGVWLGAQIIRVWKWV